MQTAVVDEEHFKALVYNPDDPRLFVVDVYSPSWGPCKIMIPTFSALVPQVDDFEDRCQLLTADASAVAELAKYNGTSCPRFLFYKDGAVVKEITGANAPAIVKTITALLPDAPRPA